jgi:hypothetical protein
MSRLRGHGCIRILLLAGLVCVASPAGSQIQNGEIVGLVADPSGAVLVNATVNIRSLETDRDFEVRTNETGFYAAESLAIGRYRLTVVAEGFTTTSSNVLTVAAGSVLRVDFMLTIARPTETVEAKSTNPSANPVNTENARLSATFDQTQVEDLPLNGRNVYDLVQYVPGATDARGVIFEEGSQTVVNGVRENFGAFLLNGLPNRSLDGGAINRPILDTIQELQVMTLNNAAEFGNSAGAITSIVTKSGTNQFHGSAWWFVRNDAFDANYFFVRRDPDPIKPAVRINQFGTTIGGPLRKNRLFFFAAYQGERIVTASPSLVLTESPQLRQAVGTVFPTSVANLLYSKFAPSTPGTLAYTLRDYVVGGQFSSSGLASFADYLCPGRTDGTGDVSPKFASLFGVEQADINQMNLPEENGGCPGGSPFPAPIAGALSRDTPFLVNVLNNAPSRRNNNEGSLRLDYNFRSRDSLFAEMNWARSIDQPPGMPGPSPRLQPLSQAFLRFPWMIPLSALGLLHPFRRSFTRAFIAMRIPSRSTAASTI